MPVNFSPLQMKSGPDVLASHIHGDTALGPNKVTTHTGICTSVDYSFSATIFINSHGKFFPRFRICWRLMSRVLHSILINLRVLPLMKSN